MERRHKRGKASRKRDVENSIPWFRDLIWSHYQRYKQKQLSNAVGALHVDGEESKEDILSRCLPYCNKMVSARVQVVLRPRKDAADPESRSHKDRDPKNARRENGKRSHEDVSYEGRAVARRYR